MAKKTPKPSKPIAAAVTKSEQIIVLLKRANGASIGELAKATGWQDHSVRGFISGTLKKKLGAAVVSVREGDRDRRYQITSRIVAGS